MRRAKSKRLEMRARRAARRLGEHVQKSRLRTTSIDNLGGYRVVSDGGIVLAGQRYELALAGLLERYEIGRA
ncbi:MAG: hypothetical protein GEU87_11720 [Alphaproteobacteria bacterium]|nr:hypothetical protein [Alphaproteobacteria bacterium]